MKKIKYLQVFNYLKEFSKLRSNPVRDIEDQETQYPEKFWLNEIPETELFENVIRKNFSADNDYWLKINKPKEPTKPSFAKFPVNLEKWINPSSLDDEDGKPQLKEFIEVNGTVLSLSDYPNILNELEEYIAKKWTSDFLEYREKLKIYQNEFEEYEKLNKVYKHLFRIFNRSEQFGEEYELVVGVGLLNFKQDAQHPKIFRHVLTQRADITFDSSQRDSFILVQPNLESFIQIETEAILDLEDQFEIQNIIDAEKVVEEFIKNKDISTVLDGENINDALQIFAERISPDGSFDNSIERQLLTNAKPRITVSPALILRKRNAQSFTALYEKIIERIKNEVDDINISSINDLIEPHDRQINEHHGANGNTEDETIYFPKEYNDEQIEIIKKAKLHSKVLVQGPPGTGKSHTIANLICHLLAKGKKILITAYTKRALEVLKEKLPVEFQDLTVNLLSGDSSSVQDLQASVNSINKELSNGSLHTYQISINELEANLKQTRIEIASRKNLIIQSKEKSTSKIEINTHYSGTLTEIAESLENERGEFLWYKDSFDDVQNEDIILDLEHYITLNEHYATNDTEDYKYDLPLIDKLPNVEQIEELKQYLDSVDDSISFTPITTSRNYGWLSANLIELDELCENFEKFENGLRQKILKESFTGNNSFWIHLLEQTFPSLEKLKKFDLQKIDADVEVIYPPDKGLKQLKNDAQILINYLKEGNSLSGKLFSLKKSFLSNSIRERLYFIEGVRVNGGSCDTVDGFETVLKDILIRQTFHDLTSLWKFQEPKIDSYQGRFIFYKNLYDDSKLLIELINQARAIQLEIEKHSNLNVIPFDLKSIKESIEGIERGRLYKNIEQQKVLLKKAEDYLINENNLHSIKERLIVAIRNYDFNLYAQCLEEFNVIKEKKNQFQRFGNLRDSLKSLVPNIVELVQLNSFLNVDVKRFKRAIFHKHASNEVEKLIRTNYELKLIGDLSELENTERRIIAKLASQKAWFKVIEGLQNNRSLRQHLNAWVLAIKKIGKTGKGKRALKFRKIAQEEMEHCKDSVPCWIMPLYKVAETVNPIQEMYDYVIIDEASQLGPDAIFLLYISKNIIIVGDDKQTSPEYVGVDANTMMPHIKRHLNDIPRSNFYGTEFSFFDHAKFFCDGVTVLREHFRCMPEIIEFSNKHFYAPEGNGLYPLKQYSENRLEPLVTEFCENAHTDGSGSRIANKVEATRIVDVISCLIKDERYNGKTFGIISLQGNHQSSMIEHFLVEAIGETEYHNRKLICGNSASFQGDERDVIFLSLVTAPNHRRSAFVKPEDERRFNVAVSRAKEQVWLFHSVQLDELSNKDDLRFKLMDHFKNYKSNRVVLKEPIERTARTQPYPFESWFEVDVYNDLVRKNLSIIPQYEVARGKYRIDLVALFPNGTKIAIECDGDKWHGPERHVSDMMRQKVLERCGWRFFRVRGYDYYTNRERALQPLWGMIPKN